MNDSSIILMNDRASRMGISLSLDQQSLFSRFSDYLLEQGAIHSLSAIKDEAGVAVRHFADSLSIVPRVLELSRLLCIHSLPDESALQVSGHSPSDSAPKRRDETTPLKLLDVGSGAGMPAIPLKILFGGSIAALALDSVAKKMRFVSEAASLLGLSGMQAVHARAEDFAKVSGNGAAFDVVTARALAPLCRAVGWCMPFVAPGGCFVSMKGRRETVDAELSDARSEIRRAGARVERIDTFCLEDADGSPMERTVIVFRR